MSSRIGGPKVLLAVLAASILALGLVAFLVLSGDGRDAGAPAAEDGRPDARRPEARVSGAGEGGEPAAGEERRSERRERRRLRSAQQRQKLIAAIEMARAARLAGRLGSEGQPGSAGDVGEGRLSKESIQDAVQAVIEDVKACYDAQLKVSPDLGGKIVLDFTINAEEGVGGVVDRVEVSDESDEPMRLAEQLAECIVDAIYTLELPSPEGGGTVDVSYPMYMTPGDPDNRSE